MPHHADVVKLRSLLSARQSLSHALYRVYGGAALQLLLLKLVWGALTIASAYAFLRGILTYVTAVRNVAPGAALPPFEPALGYALAMIAASLLSTFAVHTLYSRMSALQHRVWAAVGVLAHQRIFVRGDRGAEFAGAAVTLVGGDCQDIGALVVALPYAVTNVIEVVAICALAIGEITVSALPAIGVLLVLVMPMLFWSSRAMIAANAQASSGAQRHADASSEFLTAIKLAKYNAWEMYFARRIEKFRALTALGLQSRTGVRAATYALVFATPVVIAAIAFPMFDSLNPGALTAVVAFSIVSLFNMLRYPLLSSPQVTIDIAGGLVAIRRLEHHLFDVYVDDLAQTKLERPKGKNVLLELKNASFTYPGLPLGAAPALRKVSIKCEIGKVVAVVGPTGSAKTTLMLALLRRLRLSVGSMRERENLQRSFAQQEAWLFVGTIRDNILFGAEFDEQRYKTVIDVCCLQTDLDQMQLGDMTMLGERGAGLSGGQKQRVSVARACYSRAELVLLDDPLSALDAKVGRTLFEKCIRGFLRDRAVVLVTHALYCAELCDSVVRLRSSVVAASGKPADVLPSGTDAPIEIPDEKAHLIMPYRARIAAPYERRETLAEQKLINLLSTVSETTRDTEKWLDRAGRTRRDSMRSVQSHDDEQAADDDDADADPDDFEAADESDSASDDGMVRSIRRPSSGVSAASTRSPSLRGSEQPPIAPSSGVTTADAATPAAAGTVAVGAEAPAVAPAEKVRGNAVAYAVSPPGGLISGVLLFYFFAVHGVRIAGDFWLSFWSGKTLPFGGGTLPVWQYAVGYGVFTVAFIIGVYTRNIALGKVTITKAKALHDGVLAKLTRAPLAYFERVPFGITLALLTKHQAVIDRNLPDTLAEAMQYTPLAVGSALVAMAVYPWAFLSLVVLGPAIVLLMVRYLPRQLDALNEETKSRAHVFEVVASHAQGAVTIMAFGALERMELAMFDAVDMFVKRGAALKRFDTIIAVWMDVFVSALIGVIALLVVFQPTFETPSRAGVAIANVLQLLVFTQWSIKAIFSARRNAESAGLLAKAIGSIASEAPPPADAPQLAADWPKEGAVSFEHVSIAYGGPTGKVALNNVSLAIRPRERIGVVGRTGSGKSTAIAALFRIVEANSGGHIVIDGVRTCDIALNDLRSRIAIVPQESIVLADTVRRNLDPVGRFADDHALLWRALRQVKLASLVERAGGLDAIVETGGGQGGDDDGKKKEHANHVRLSAGQRQLLCIARASLMPARVVTLDEATAAIDRESDEMAQKAMARAFKGRTVITIAHRLDTIIGSDRILVLDAGKVVEFDTPTALLANPDGMLRMLVNSTGPATAARLEKMANDAAKAKLQTQKVK
jgi:ABC-type multidrug transport system fused ATPase/permease subunit